MERLMSDKEPHFRIGQRIQLKSTLNLFDGKVEAGTVGVLKMWDEGRKAWKVDFPHKGGVYVVVNNMRPAVN